MDKRKLITTFIDQLAHDIQALKETAKATIEAATNEESRPENEYDTRGLEASYLARGQAKRVAEMEEVLVLLKHLNPKDFGPDDGISSSALVEVEHNNKRSFFFILALGGGMSVPFEGKSIQIVTPSSPLGEALLDQKAGGIAVVETGSQVREYDILNIW
ncbi:MAG: hypothetical protein AAGB31_15220 [Bdellovibrio sp.]